MADYLLCCLKKIVVYYLLDTHYAKIKKGYSSGDGDAFAYIIESGKVWKNNIENQGHSYK